MILPQMSFLEPNSEISFELSKAYFILLIYEHEYIIPLNMYKERKEALNLKEKRSENDTSFKSDDKSKDDISFFSSLSLEQMKNQSKSNISLSNSLSYYNISAKYAKIDDML